MDALRAIGWSLWDPIGLGTAGAAPESGVDEYDSYLHQVAGMLRHGEAAEAATEFLMQIEAEHMAMGEQPDARERAEATVAAIAGHIAAPR